MFAENYVDLNAYTVSHHDRATQLSRPGEQARFMSDADGVLNRNVIVRNAQGTIIEQKNVSKRNQGNGYFTAKDASGKLVVDGFAFYDYKTGRETIHGNHMQLLKVVEYHDDGMINAIEHYEDGQRKTRTLYENWREKAHLAYDDNQRVAMFREPGLSAHFQNAHVENWPRPYGLKYGMPFNEGAQIAVKKESEHGQTLGYYSHEGELMDLETFSKSGDGVIRDYTGQIRGLCAKPGQGICIRYDEEKSSFTEATHGLFVGAAAELTAPPILLQIQHYNDKINRGLY